MAVSFQKDLKEMGVRMDGGYSSHEAMKVLDMER